MNYFSLPGTVWVRRLDPDRIITSVSKHTKIPVRDMLRASRKHNIVRARFISIYLIRRYVKLNYNQIARMFGYADHTSVIHALNTINNELGYDEQLVQDIRLIKQRI